MEWEHELVGGSLWHSRSRVALLLVFGPARLGLGRGGPMLANQGHLWGEGSEAGGRRLEGASGARPGPEHRRLLGKPVTLLPHCERICGSF